KSTVAKLYKENKKCTALDVLKCFQTNDMFEVFPNLTVAYQIFLTIPVSVASCERSFSKLKLVKNCLRLLMGQDRLSHLAMLSIESKVASNINFDNLLQEFASAKCRKMK